MAAFGGSASGSSYVGGGDLWEEPCPPEPRWWNYLFAVLIFPFRLIRWLFLFCTFQWNTLYYGGL